MKLTRLSDALNSFVEQSGLSKRDVADMISVSDATLRTWFQRNTFPKHAVEAICSAIGWEKTTEDLEGEFDVGARWNKPYLPAALPLSMPNFSLEALFRTLDRKRQRLGPHIERMSSDTALLLSAMRAGDLFVFTSSTVTPLEFEKHAGLHLAQAIADGLLRGGTYLYLRPCAACVKEIYEVIRMRRILQIEDMEREITDYRQLMIRYLLERKKRPFDDAVEMVYRQIQQYYISTPLFWMPGFTIGFFQTSSNSGELIDRFTLRTPSPFWGVIHLPKDDLFSWRFRKFLHLALDEESTKNPRTITAKTEPDGLSRRQLQQIPRWERTGFERIRAIVEAKFQPE